MRKILAVLFVMVGLSAWAANPDYKSFTNSQFSAPNGGIIEITNLGNNLDGGWVSGRAFGLVGDGSTDNTKALSNAISSGKKVVLTNGVYVTTALGISNNTFLLGPATIRFKSGSTGTMLSMNNAETNCIFDGITFDGISSNSPSRTGVYINGDSAGSNFKNCRWLNWGSTAVHISAVGSSASQPGNPHLQITGEIGFSVIGLDTTPVGGYPEYLNFSKLDIHDCGLGVNNLTGNNTWTGMHITDCAQAMRIALGNNIAHSPIIGVLFNHNVQSLFIQDVTGGQSQLFQGCYFAGTTGPRDIVVTNSLGIVFDHCFLNSGMEIICTNTPAGGMNRMENCFYPGNWSSMLIKNDGSMVFTGNTSETVTGDTDGSFASAIYSARMGGFTNVQNFLAGNWISDMRFTSLSNLWSMHINEGPLQDMVVGAVAAGAFGMFSTPSYAGGPWAGWSDALTRLYLVGGNGASGDIEMEIPFGNPVLNINTNLANFKNLIITARGYSNLWNTLSPEMFGIIGDGNTDETAKAQALESAHEAAIAKGIPSVIQWGTTNGIKITGPIIITNKFNWEGGSYNNLNTNGSFTFRLSGATAGMVMTNNNVWGMTMKNMSFIDAGYSATGTPTAGQTAIKFLSTNANSQDLKIQDCMVAGCDRAVILTNMNELNIDGLKLFNATNSLSIGQVGAQGMQACKVSRLQINSYGTSLAVGGGDYTFYDTDIGGASITNANAVFIKDSPSVVFINPNIEAPSIKDKVHFNLFLDNSTVTAFGGAMNQTGLNLIPVFLTNSAAFRFSGTAMAIDANNVCILSQNNTGYELSCEYGSDFGGALASFRSLTNAQSSIGVKFPLMTLPFNKIWINSLITANPIAGYGSVEIGSALDQATTPCLFNFGNVLFMSLPPVNHRMDIRDSDNTQLFTVNPPQFGGINLLGTQTITNAPSIGGSTGPTIYFVTNNTAANFSLLMNVNGVYMRTNGVWKQVAIGP